MKKIMMTLIAVTVSFSTLSADNDRPVQTSQLPQLAQTFLNKHFKDSKIAMVTSERDWLIMDQEYNVVFANGDKIEFDSKGNWENIECRHASVPQNIVPNAITTYIGQAFPGTSIKEIDHDRRGYDVELCNGVEVKFDNSFKAYKIDD